MGRKYVRKTSRQSWTSEAMQKAVEAIRAGEMGTLRASKQFNVPRTTLQRCLKSSIVTKMRLGSKLPVFSPETEAELVQHIKDMDSRFFGFTTGALRRVVYQFAEINHLQHPFSREDKSAGKDWLRGFFARNPQLSVRMPENTSAARAAGFNAVSVGKFFDLLENEMEKKQFTPDCIYNVDETGVTTVPNKPAKVIAPKGKKQVGTLTSGERGELVTTVVCMSASGHYVPPFFIFPRARMRADLLDHAPPGAVGVAHKSGWMQTEIFLDWFKHFLRHCHPTAERPLLLIMDGHKTHTLNLDVINLARERNVTLLCLPPHSSHRLQPLDVGFMKPLMAAYTVAVNNWLRNHPGRIVTVVQIGELFGKAFLHAATPQTAVKAFKTTGISPCNRQVFTDADFTPALTTDRSVSVQSQDKPAPVQHQSAPALEVRPTTDPLPSTSQDHFQPPLVPHQSVTVQPASEVSNPPPSTSEVQMQPAPVQHQSAPALEVRPTTDPLPSTSQDQFRPPLVPHQSVTVQPASEVSMPPSTSVVQPTTMKSPDRHSWVPITSVSPLPQCGRSETSQRSRA